MCSCVLLQVASLDVTGALVADTASARVVAASTTLRSNGTLTVVGAAALASLNATGQATLQGLSAGATSLASLNVRAVENSAEQLYARNCLL